MSAAAGRMRSDGVSSISVVGIDARPPFCPAVGGEGGVEHLSDEVGGGEAVGATAEAEVNPARKRVEEIAVAEFASEDSIAGRTGLSPSLAAADEKAEGRCALPRSDAKEPSASSGTSGSGPSALLTNDAPRGPAQPASAILASPSTSSLTFPFSAAVPSFALPSPLRDGVDDEGALPDDGEAALTGVETVRAEVGVPSAGQSAVTRWNADALAGVAAASTSRDERSVMTDDGCGVVGGARGLALSECGDDERCCPRAGGGGMRGSGGGGGTDDSWRAGDVRAAGEELGVGKAATPAMWACASTVAKPVDLAMTLVPPFVPLRAAARGAASC